MPSRPVAGRVRIWRRLSRAGAVQLKDALYILPRSAENYEFFEWLTAEVASLKGEAAFIVADRVETLGDERIIELFNAQRERDYRSILEAVARLDGRISAIRKGTRPAGLKGLTGRMGRLLREFEEIRNTDFFRSIAGRKTREKLEALDARLRELAEAGPEKKAPSQVRVRLKKDYQRRTWVTRRKPYVDRMASAWLIRKFIDREASFQFADAEEIGALRDGAVAFDVRGGEFTHEGDNCTFETLMKAFSMRDGALRRIARVVHEIDVKDDKYRSPETAGVEEVLGGIRKTAGSDAEALEKGMAVFDMLYASRSGA